MLGWKNNLLPGNRGDIKPIYRAPDKRTNRSNHKATPHLCKICGKSTFDGYLCKSCYAFLKEKTGYIKKESH